MWFNFGPKSGLLLIFFYNALVFAALLLRRGILAEERASRWLAAFLFLCALYICPFMLGYGGWYSRQPYRDILFYVPFQQLFLLGPVFYFFTRSLLDRDFRFRRRDLWHLLPAGLYLLYSLVVFATDKLWLGEYYFYADQRDKDLKFEYQLTGLVSMAVYFSLSLRLYFRYRRYAVQEASFAEAIRYGWIKYYLVTFLCILLLRILFFILNPEWGEFGSKFWYYLCFSGLFFLIGLQGITHGMQPVLALDPEDGQVPIPESGGQQEEVRDAPDLHAWTARITGALDAGEAFREPDLTLTEWAGRLGTNRSVLSAAINQGFGMNFNDFVNARRAEAVIAGMREGRLQQVTLLALALECGFNSKSTFNRAFRKYTGLSPKEYLKRNGL